MKHFLDSKHIFLTYNDFLFRVYVFFLLIMLDLMEINADTTHGLAEFGDKLLRLCAVNILVFRKTYFVGNSYSSSHPVI